MWPEISEMVRIGCSRARQLKLREVKMKIRRSITSKEIMSLLRKHNDVLKKYGVKKIGLFGSYIKGEQKKYSDIDFIVEFEKADFDNFMDLVFYLENLFGRKVDILTPEGVKSIRIKKVAENIRKSVIYV